MLKFQKDGKIDDKIEEGINMFEQGGHHTFLLFPEAYTSVIRDFLKER